MKVTWKQYYKMREKEFLKWLNKKEPGPIKKYYRQRKTVMRDWKLPQRTFLYESEFDFRVEMTKRRTWAIIEVLRRLPQYSYTYLFDHRKFILLDMPAGNEIAYLKPFHIPDPEEYDEKSKEIPFITERGNRLVYYGCYIFLPPHLEEFESRIIIHAVAHELAHVFIDGHTLQGFITDINEEDRKFNEKMVDLLIQKWRLRLDQN